MRWELVLVAPCVLGACFMARQDARIRPGGQIGVTSVVMYTPDAVASQGDDHAPGEPQVSDGSDVRGLTVASIAYGWKRAELRWTFPLVRWNATNEFFGDDPNAETMNPILGDLELYIQIINQGTVFAGVGYEPLSGGFAVVTGELDPCDAISLTVRGHYDSEDKGAYNDPDVQTSALLQAQLSYAHTLDAKHDLHVLVSALTFRGDLEPPPVRVYGSNEAEVAGYPYVTARTIWMVGASIDWH